MKRTTKPTQIEPKERDALIDALAAHFVRIYGAPDLEAARPVAEQEVSFMSELCEDHDENTLLAVQRELTPSGVREQFRAIKSADAEVEQIAMHETEEW